ncbi:MAG TPA: glycine zipper 2TM domain-containing protein [Gammaproteobacteria bacterium]|jgi:outer membrane lipoprotein SlyB
MRKIPGLFVAVLAAAALMVGCASNDTQPANYGVVKSINPTTESSSGLNAGTLIGGAIGGLAGHQVGSGRGNTAATVAGAVGGAVIGTQVDKDSKSKEYKIGVRMQDGTFVTINQKGSVADLRVGQRVKVEDGQVYPV